MTEIVWVADLEFVTEHAPTNDLLREMAEDGEQREWSVSALGAQPGARVLVYIEGPDLEAAPLAAVQPVANDVLTWVEKHLPGATIGSVRLVTEQQLELEALTPSLPELAAAADVAELLGVSRQRVWQLAKSHPQFPAPIVRVSSGPLWTRDAIDWFASVWERKGGRPPRAQGAGMAKRYVAVKVKPVVKTGRAAVKTGRASRAG